MALLARTARRALPVVAAAAPAGSSGARSLARPGGALLASACAAAAVAWPVRAMGSVPSGTDEMDLLDPVQYGTPERGDGTGMCVEAVLLPARKTAPVQGALPTAQVEDRH